MQVVVDDIAAAAPSFTTPASTSERSRVPPSGRFVYFSDPDGNGWAVQQFPVAA
jgi:hypothetical protein